MACLMEKHMIGLNGHMTYIMRSSPVSPVGLDGGRRVLHLHVLVAHQRPRSEAARVQFERSLEVQRRLLVLRAQTVVIT